MKNLLLIISLSLISCGPSDFYNLVGHRRFKVGDCLIASNKIPESWENNNPSYIVKEIGQKSYRTCFVNNNHVTSLCGSTENISFGHLWEDFYQVVPCGELK